MEHYPTIKVAWLVGDLYCRLLSFLNRACCFLLMRRQWCLAGVPSTLFTPCELEARAGVSPYGARGANELLGFLLERTAGPIGGLCGRRGRTPCIEVGYWNRSAVGGSGPSYRTKGREPDPGWIAAFEAGSRAGRVSFLRKCSHGRKAGFGSNNV